MKKPNFKKVKPKSWTNMEVYNFYKALQQVGPSKNLFLTSAVQRTLRNLEPYVKAMEPETLIPHSEDAKKFREKVLEINKKFSKEKIVKGEDGFDRWDVPENDPKYKKAIEALEKEFEEALKERKEQQKEWVEFMNEDFPEEVPLVKVPMEKVPNPEEEDPKVNILLAALIQ